ncbi:hypothetical protein EVAR_41294_1 [Eumeta japonica]|uniref:Uncharacterized protein n=1 Tax=Eumeta variegata TaxID=151549 RepID=A0A4C1XAP7_EUMVA|nr:hypothetical protein EVAR_41294_1 [Eumeta japonica]
MSSPPPVQVEVEVGDDSMEEDCPDMLPVIDSLIHFIYHLLQPARQRRKDYLVVGLQEAFDRQLIHS